jgi:hypothetical protein
MSSRAQTAAQTTPDERRWRVQTYDTASCTEPTGTQPGLQHTRMSPVVLRHRCDNATCLQNISSNDGTGTVQRGPRRARGRSGLISRPQKKPQHTVWSIACYAAALVSGTMPLVFTPQADHQPRPGSLHPSRCATNRDAREDHCKSSRRTMSPGWTAGPLVHGQIPGRRRVLRHAARRLQTCFHSCTRWRATRSLDARSWCTSCSAASCARWLLWQTRAPAMHVTPFSRMLLCAHAGAVRNLLSEDHANTVSPVRAVRRRGHSASFDEVCQRRGSCTLLLQ